MKLYVKATVWDFKLTWPSSHYIKKAKYEFNINYEIIEKDFIILKDIYHLKLEGDQKNIKSFLSYLRMTGFEITVY